MAAQAQDAVVAAQATQAPALPTLPTSEATEAQANARKRKLEGEAKAALEASTATVPQSVPMDLTEPKEVEAKEPA